MIKSLWEILVPKCWNDGTEITLLHHNIWHNEITKLAGGLSISRSIKGVWQNEKLKIERMIPVRIMCDYETMLSIVKWSASWYKQDAIMYYKITDDVRIYHRKEDMHLPLGTQIVQLKAPSKTHEHLIDTINWGGVGYNDGDI